MKLSILILNFNNNSYSYSKYKYEQINTSKIITMLAFYPSALNMLNRNHIFLV